jgi:hypothetical protein
VRFGGDGKKKLTGYFAAEYNTTDYHIDTMRPWGFFCASSSWPGISFVGFFVLVVRNWLDATIIAVS